MASYALFIPNVHGSSPSHLEAVGLGSLLKDGAPECADCFDGPDHKRGIIALWRTGQTDRDPPFDAKSYDWQPAKADKARGLAAGRFYFGVEKGKRVEPRDIARRESIAGYPLTLADGQVWRIPAAVHLPHRHELDEDGQFVRTVADEYREFWQASERYAVQFFEAIGRLDILNAKRPQIDTSNATVSFTLSDADYFACQAVAINYRLTPEIANFLGILDDTATRNIVKATIDLTAILETRDDQKKTDELSIPVG